MFLGVGHFIARSYRRGFIWLGIGLALFTASIIALITPRFLPILWLTMPATVVATLWAYVDAYLTGRRSSPRVLTSPWKRYLAGIVLLVVGYFFQVGL